MQQLLEGEEAQGPPIYIYPLAHTLLESRRSEILEWVSATPYTEHHTRISATRLEETGEWLFQKEEYQDWVSSGTSKLLLLRDIRKFWLHSINYLDPAGCV